MSCNKPLGPFLLGEDSDMLGMIIHSSDPLANLYRDSSSLDSFVNFDAKGAPHARV